MNKIVFIFTLLFSINAAASFKTVTLQPSEYSKIRIFSSTYPTVGAARMATIYQALPDGCSKGLWFDPKENPEIYSTALAAFMAGKVIEIRYAPNGSAPWGDSAWCRLEWVTIIK